MAARPIPEKTVNASAARESVHAEQGVRVRVCGMHYIDGGGDGGGEGGGGKGDSDANSGGGGHILSQEQRREFERMADRGGHATRRTCALRCDSSR